MTVGTRATSAAVAATLVAALTAACDSDPVDRSSPTPTITATPPSVDPAVEQARATVKQVYDRYRRAYVVAAATSDYKNGDLPKYVADPLLAEIRQDLWQRQTQGLITKGQPKWNARVTDVNLATRPFAATIEDCFDSTRWNTVHKDTGKSAAVPGQAKKYLVTAQAVQYDDGRWFIRSSTADRDRPC